jgi:di- and tripeptidase
MIKILAKLVSDDNKVLIPGMLLYPLLCGHLDSFVSIKSIFVGFYDDVRPVSPAEERLYDPIISWMHRSGFNLFDITFIQHSFNIFNLSLKSQVASSDVSNALHITLNSLSLGDGQKRKNGEEHTKACDPEQLKKSLMARWRYPTFTVHKIDVSLNNPTIIPRQATAAISMRIVPDQDINVICEQFKRFVENTAQSLGTDNKVTVR